MPFGIPPSQDEAYGDLVSGIEANINDLTKFGAVVSTNLQAGGAANAKDLARVTNRLNNRLSKGINANAADLNPVSQTLAMQLVAGTQANAMDLAQGTAQAPTAPPTIWTFYLDDLHLGSSCHFAVRGGTDQTQFPAVDPATGYFAYGVSYDTRETATAIAWSVIQAHCANPPADADRTGNGSTIGNGTHNGTTPPACAADPHATFVVLWDAQACPQQIEVFCYVNAADLQNHLAATGLFVESTWILQSEANAHKDQLIASIPGACLTNGQVCPEGTTGTPPDCTPVCQPGQPCDTGNGATKIEKPPPCTPIDWDALGVPDGIPMPAGEDDCRFLAVFETQFAGLADTLVAWADANLNMSLVYDWIDNFQPDPAWPAFISTAMNLFVDALGYIVELTGPILDTILCGLRSIIRLMARLHPQCGSNAFIPLMFMKWLLGATKHFEGGTDAFAWLVGKIDLQYGPVEEKIDQLIRYFLPLELPSTEQATEAWMLGQISVEVRDCVWRLWGHCPGTYLNYAMARSERLTDDQILRYSYRQDMPDGVRDALLYNRGWKLDFDRQARQELHWELPTIQDHLHWLTKNVDDREYVKHFGLLDGFSSEEFIRSLPGWQDYQVLINVGDRDFWRTYGHDLTAQGMKPEVAAFHYAAHWIQPAPTQMQEFVYRLRPGAPGMEVAFTLDDYKRILAEQDYAPLAREWFAATAYRVPALTYIIGMYRKNVIDEARLKEYHQDLGYTPGDSDNFVRIDKIEKFRMRTNEYHGWTPQAIADAFITGRLDADGVRTKLIRIGGTADEAQDLMDVAESHLNRQVWQRARTRLQWRTATRVQQSLQVGVLTDDDAVRLLTDLGYPERYARGVVEAERATSRTSLVKSTVAAVKRSLHDGYITGEQAVELLGAAGVIQPKTDEYLALWGIQNTPKRKRRTAAQIVTDLSLGMMDTTEALFRLGNLGYADADSILYLADAQRKIIGRQAKATAAAQRDARAQAAQIARLQRQAQTQARQLRGDLERIAPRSVLTKWLKRGLIGPAQFRLRLEKLGYPDAEISLYVADAPTSPTVAELQKLAKGKAIAEPEFRTKLAELGYDQRDIDNFAALAFPPAQVPGP